MGYPQLRMYWTKGTRVPLVSNNMARDRYFLILSNLKIVVIIVFPFRMI